MMTRNIFRFAAPALLGLATISLNATLSLSESGSIDGNDWVYHAVDITDATADWRIVMYSESGTPSLHLRKDSEPTSSGNADFNGSSFANDPYHTSTILVPQEDLGDGTWYIGVRNTDSTPLEYTLSARAENAVTELSWDDGSSPVGTDPYTVEAGDAGGLYRFTIDTRDSALGAWRHALNVEQGKARLWIRQGNTPSFTSSPSNQFESEWTATGAGFVLPLSTSGVSSTTWHIAVVAEPGAQWSLTAGDVHVADLGELEADDSSGAEAVIPAEGVAYFRTTIPQESRAWRLWIQPDDDSAGTLPLEFELRANAVPAPTSRGNWSGWGADHDFQRTGQALFVPGEVDPASGDTWFISVRGEPGESFHLDSRRQPVTDIDFGEGPVAGGGDGSWFHTFRLSIQSAELLGWEITAIHGSGDAYVSARQGEVANQWFNAAYSEIDGGVDNSFTLVKPELTDGTWYVTIYGEEDISFQLRNRAPEVTTIDYTSVTINNDPNRVGWRYFQMVDSDAQVEGLGWLLELLDEAPDTRIAIRRTDLPGSVNRRYDGFDNTIDHSEEEGVHGFLQRPDHQSETWYIGIYTEESALGEFTLESGSIPAPNRDPDGVRDEVFDVLRPHEWVYYRVEIPETVDGEDVRGWEIRASSGGETRAPMIAVQRDTLPSATFNSGGAAGRSESWSSGGRIVSSSDWTGRSQSADGSVFQEQNVFSVPMGQPLEPGTYYIGFRNNSWNEPTGVQWSSRLIGEEGSGLGYEISNLDFIDGTSTGTLEPRAISYYAVDIPEDQPNWRVRLNLPEDHEAQLFIRKDFLPNPYSSGAAFYNPATPLVNRFRNNFNINGMQVRLNTDGDESFDLWPSSSNNDHISAGRYYLMVVSNGKDPAANNRVGAEPVEYTLASLGNIEIDDIGLVEPGVVIQKTDQSYAPGQMNYYRFEVPEGLSAVAVRLLDKEGNPYLRMRAGSQPPAISVGASGGTTSTYGQYSGIAFTDFHADVIYIATPEPGYHSLTVASQSAVKNAASYHLEIEAIEPAAIPIDGYAESIEGLPANEWLYYEVEVPEDILGWEIRVTDWEDMRPWIVVRRDSPPDTTASGSAIHSQFNPGDRSSWSSGNYVVTNAGDWTGRSRSADGKNNESYLFSFAMTQPLEPGTYYVGFRSLHNTDPANFSWTSRAIGAPNSGYSLEATALAFDGEDSSSSGELEPREVQFYSVEIPDETHRSWRIELALENEGDEARLFARRDRIPNSHAGGNSNTNFAATQTVLRKDGDEHFVLWPTPGETYIQGGTYYFAVVSEGNEPDGIQIGAESIQYQLISHGEAEIEDIGTIPVAGETSLENEYGSGQQNYYQFTVPEGVLSMELRLDDREGNPSLNLIEGEFPSSLTNGYGHYSGRSSGTIRDGNRITISEPDPGTYTLTTAHGSGSSFNPGTTPGSYTLRITTAGATEIHMDGFSDTVTELDPLQWVYYRVDVPEDIDGHDVLGWELSILDWEGSEPPIMSIQRGSPPDNTSSSGTIQGQATRLNWNDGDRMLFSSTTNGWRDWTRRPFSADGETEHERITASFPMGQPLEPGTYFIGFRTRTAGADPVSFTWQSKAIGPEGSGMSHEIRGLDFEDSVSGTVSPREVSHYYVDIPEGTTSWKTELQVADGKEAHLYIRGIYPAHTQLSASHSTDPGNWRGTGSLNSPQVRLANPGGQQFALWPDWNEDELLPGRYFLTVVGIGHQPEGENRVGTGEVAYTLHSHGPAEVEDLGELPAIGTILNPDIEYVSGEVRYYRFEVIEGTKALELRMTNRIGSPRMALLRGELPARLQFGHPFSTPIRSYGQYSGYGADHYADDRITIGAPEPGIHWLTVGHGDQPGYGNGGYDLEIRAIDPTPLEFSFNAPANRHSGSVAADQSHFYSIEVEDSLEMRVPDLGETESEVIGWRIRLIEHEGSAEVRIRPEETPHGSDFNQGQTRWRKDSVLISPPLLHAGAWYLEVRGETSADYTIISEPVLHSSLDREIWRMPAKSEPTDTPGLSGATFADTGVDPNGDPLFAADQGVDLDRGDFHLYAIEVPEDNGGLLRTILDNLSGDPDLYIRPGNLPTVSHGENLSSSSSLALHRLLDNNVTERSAWVPFDVRETTRLEPGLWFLKVLAAGDTSARYRLRLSHNADSLVQDIAMDGGSFENQILAARDWRYYKVTLPETMEDTPDEWTITYSENSGNVVLYLRDGAPPGQWQTGSVNTSNFYSNPRDWSNDDSWPSARRNYRRMPNAGTHVIKGDELVVGETYYIGVRASSDAVFSIESSIGTGTIEPDYGEFAEIEGTGATLEFTLQEREKRTWKVRLPAEANRWRSVAANNEGVHMYIGPHRLLPYLNGEANNFLQNDGEADWVAERNFFSSFRDVPNTFFVTAHNQTPEAQDVTLFIDWREAEDFEIDISIVGNGDVTTAPVEYLPGETITLTANADPGWFFAGWSGEVESGDNPLEITPYDEISIVANFEMIEGAFVSAAQLSSNQIAIGEGAGEELEIEFTLSNTGATTETFVPSVVIDSGVELWTILLDEVVVEPGDTVTQTVTEDFADINPDPDSPYSAVYSVTVNGTPAGTFRGIYVETLLYWTYVDEWGPIDIGDYEEIGYRVHGLPDDAVSIELTVLANGDEIETLTASASAGSTSGWNYLTWYPDEPGEYHVTVNGILAAGSPAIFVGDDPDPDPDPDPPVIERHPDGLVVNHGQSAQFSVIAEGEGELEYRWYHNGQQITEFSSSSELTIASVTITDEGTYSAEVMSEYGVTFSNHATLQVLVSEDLPEAIADAVAEEHGFYRSAWLGLFFSGEGTGGWIHSSELGWVYIWHGQEPGSVWMMDPALDTKVFTSAEHYPYLYSSEHGWMNYVMREQAPTRGYRWIYFVDDEEYREYPILSGPMRR